jgi:hypothetical protein
MIHTLAQLFSTTVPQQHKAKHIYSKEMYAVLHIKCTSTTKSRTLRVEQHSDNKAVMPAIEKHSITGQGFILLRQIAMHMAFHDIQLHSVWITTKENAVADALSRWDTEKIAYLCPNLH